ncbi:MAG: L28 family ribosomal protein [Patescibacteria group bacterium]
MSRRCDFCYRGPTKMTSRSHSNIASRRWVYVNVQPKTIDGKGVKICTRCLKTQIKKKSEER